MKNETRKHKIERSYKRSKTTKDTLDKKENTSFKYYGPTVLKSPKILYDTGWIGVNETVGNITGTG